MLQRRAAEARGAADFGWLKSRHTFSFGRYYDPMHMGFRALRVINDDWVAPGAGFDTHGHRDMEIISLVLQGQIAHKDSTGQAEILPAGEFQLMSAGRGISHSEFNPDPAKPLRFLQIWIEPNVAGQAPSYQQKRFEMQAPLTLIASPDGSQGSLQLKQDARLYQLNLAADSQLTQALDEQRFVYLHLIEGSLKVQQSEHEPWLTLNAGDGLKVSQQQALTLQSGSAVQALWFDLA